MRWIRERFNANCLIGLAIFSLVSCASSRESKAVIGPDASKTPSGIAGSFVGKVDGSETFVGIVVLETREVLAYVCDGRTTSQWFRGEAGSESLSLAAGEARLEATLSTDGATGNLRLGPGPTLNFRAQPSEGDAGLYRATTIDGNRSYVGGWIVLADGAQRGSVAASNATSATTTRASAANGPGEGSPPIATDTVSVSGPSGAGQAVAIIGEVGAVFTSLESAIALQFSKLAQPTDSKGKTPTSTITPVVVSNSATLQPKKLTSGVSVIALK